MSVKAFHIVIMTASNCNNTALLALRSRHLNLIVVTSTAASLETTTLICGEGNAIHPGPSANSHSCYEFTLFKIKSFPVLVARLSSSMCSCSHIIIIFTSVYHLDNIDVVTLSLDFELLHVWNIFFRLKTFQVIEIIESG